MNNTRGKLDGIIDIIAPTPPVEAAVDVLSWLLLGLVMLAAVVAYLWFRRPRQRLRRELTALHNAVRHNVFDGRAAVYRLSALLRQACHRQQLHAQQPLPDKLRHQQLRWQAFMEQLDHYRYSPDTLSASDFPALATEAQYWLKVWP
ncbi:DUF4381 family protein [Sulfuriflexus mobilis]|uniref:DUF4381 family protein n=1 Tax=Sulfuriflexus mobilis TaxID=1811807 RepID=UPI000F836BB7|nr:DUF4381 family protein [Sulfuriflexus mobilis]